MRISSVCTLLLTLVISSGFTQQNYSLNAKDSRMIFTGTSSLHSWQCRVEQPSGKLAANVDNQLKLTIQSLTLSIPTTSIKSISEKGEYYDKNMDKNMYRALNTDKFPSLTFTLSQSSVKGARSKIYSVEGIGILKINGVAKEVTLTAQCTVASTEIIFEGKFPLKMRDYNVEPPTAIFGTIKTGNDIVVQYKMVYRLLPN